MPAPPHLLLMVGELLISGPQVAQRLFQRLRRTGNPQIG
jgi:hypothetical protein